MYLKVPPSCNFGLLHLELSNYFSPHRGKIQINVLKNPKEWKDFTVSLSCVPVYTTWLDSWLWGRWGLVGSLPKPGPSYKTDNQNMNAQVITHTSNGSSIFSAHSVKVLFSYFKAEDKNGYCLKILVSNNWSKNRQNWFQDFILGTTIFQPYPLSSMFSLPSPSSAYSS